MADNKILIAGLVGGIVSFLAGFLIWVVLLGGFADANAGSATGVTKEEMGDMWATILGALCSGYLVALIFGKWASISTWKTGAKRGAILGLLIGLNINLIMYGTTHITTLQLALVDSLAYTLLYTIIGAVVGFMLGRGVKTLEEAMA